HIAVAFRFLIVQPLGELGLGDHLARTQHQVLENPILEARQLDRCAAHLDGLSACVEGYFPAHELGTCPAPCATQQRLHARQHFLEVKGLGDVVISPRLQAFDLVLPAISRSQDQNRVTLALRAQAADQLEARKLGQPEIDDCDIQWELNTGEQALFAIARHIHREARLGESRLERLAERGLVLDDQNPHATDSYITLPLEASTRTVQTRPESLSSRRTYTVCPSLCCDSARTTRALKRCSAIFTAWSMEIALAASRIGCTGAAGAAHRPAGSAARSTIASFGQQDAGRGSVIVVRQD